MKRNNGRSRVTKATRARRSRGSSQRVSEPETPQPSDSPKASVRGQLGSDLRMRTGRTRTSRRWASWRMAGQRSLRSGVDRVIDLLFPPVCAACHDALAQTVPGQVLLCQACRSTLEPHPQLPACPACGIGLSPGVPNRDCPICRRHRFRFRRTVTLGPYEGDRRQAVIRMKQFHEYPLMVATGKLLASRVTTVLGGHGEPGSAVSTLRQATTRMERELDFVVPIPKFWLKRLWRGTNTSEVLAETIAKELRIPVDLDALVCRRATHKQSLLGREDRRRNASGSLGLRKHVDLCGANVLIVDDIMTTGSTANEATRALKVGGIRSATVAVVARASQYGPRTAERAG